MVISKLSKTQNSDNKHSELVSKLQQEARMLFYDKMMYDINNALASILAVCDTEGKEGIPKVKQYIHRINQALNNTKSYQSVSSCNRQFNISSALQNLIHVLKDKHKAAKLTCLISDIKAPVQCDQSRFEEFFLYMLISILASANAMDSEILIELRQKDQDAMITILKDFYVFGPEALEKINKIINKPDFNGNIQITNHGKGVEIIIKIPLIFHVISIGNPMPKKNLSPISSLSKIKSVQRNINSEKSLEESGREGSVNNFVF
jgi:hypothetical protein